LQRGLHDIEDELVFTGHEGYVFHDSRGFEAGGVGELEIVQNFVRRKSRERQMKDRLHAIWFVLLSSYGSEFTNFARYCIPMDNDRPELDIKYFGVICPDKNGMSKHHLMSADLHTESFSSCDSSIHEV